MAELHAVSAEAVEVGAPGLAPEQMTSATGVAGKAIGLERAKEGVFTCASIVGSLG